jgi:Glycerophosphoryl diester phosphodiesterase family
MLRVVPKPAPWLIFLLAVALSAAEAGSSGIWVVAHHGAKNAAPENTIAAFDAAAKAGANYVELDVRPTKDGELTTPQSTALRSAKAPFASSPSLKSERSTPGTASRYRPFGRPSCGKRTGVRIDVDHKDGSVSARNRESNSARSSP